MNQKEIKELEATLYKNIDKIKEQSMIEIEQEQKLNIVQATLEYQRNLFAANLVLARMLKGD